MDRRFDTAPADRISVKPGQQALGKPRRGERGRYPKHPRRGRSPLGGFSIRTSAARKDPEPAASPRPGGSPQPPPLPAPSGRDEFDRPQPGRDAVKAGLRRRRFQGARRAGPGRAEPAGGFRRVSLPGTRGGVSGDTGAVGNAGHFQASNRPSKLRQGELQNIWTGIKEHLAQREKPQTPNVPVEWKDYIATTRNKLVSW